MAVDRGKTGRGTNVNDAVRAGDATAAGRLVRAGADPNASDAEGQHPLEAAARAGDVAMIRLLLEQGADARSKQHAAVVAAAQRGHAQVLRLLLAAGADPEQPDEEGCLALCQAATGGHLEAVRVLVEAGADVRAADADENSPLRGAALRSRWDVVDYLMPISAPADQATARRRREEFERRVAEREAGATLLRTAAETAARSGVAGTRYASIRDAVAAGDEVAVGRLLASGAEVNEADSSTGRTALMLAAERGDDRLARALLAAGADAGAADLQRRGALLLAAQGGHASVVEALVDAGANARTRAAPGGNSPLLAAARNGHWAIVDFLAPLSFEDDVGQAKTLRRIAQQGVSADAARKLTDAARAGDRAVVERMLDDGIPIDTVNASGWTALMAAANGGHVDLVRRLLERSADPSLSDNYGETALDLATASEDPATFGALWPRASAKQRKAAMQRVEFNRMLPQQYPKWQGYEPPSSPKAPRAPRDRPP